MPSHASDRALVSNLFAALAVSALLGGLLGIALRWEAPGARRPVERSRPPVARGVTIALA